MNFLLQKVGCKSETSASPFAEKPNARLLQTNHRLLKPTFLLYSATYEELRKLNDCLSSPSSSFFPSFLFPELFPSLSLSLFSPLWCFFSFFLTFLLWLFSPFHFSSQSRDCPTSVWYQRQVLIFTITIDGPQRVKPATPTQEKKLMSPVSTNITARIPNHPKTTRHHHPLQATISVKKKIKRNSD